MVWGLKEVLILRGVNTRLIASETFRTYRGWLHRLLVGPVLVLDEGRVVVNVNVCMCAQHHKCVCAMGEATDINYMVKVAGSYILDILYLAFSILPIQFLLF